MNYLAKVFINNNWMVKLVTVILLTIFLSGIVYIIIAVSLFLSTVLNLPGLVVLAFLVSVSLILFSIVHNYKEEK